MAKEQREFYDKNSNPTGITYFKGDKAPDGLYPMVVMVCIQNSKGEFLMQKRVPEKGGDYGVTGGHPKKSETPIEGMLTEIKEELGISVNESDLEIFDEGCDGTDCYKMYYLKLDLEVQDFVIQKEELTEVEWFSISKLQEMVENKILNPNQIACFLKCMKYLESKNK
ncbi:MAG: NUDIX domain-containing protein [Clostridia bacterium]|nr:NUDIX domain-containing protein [Clostridia bacterium]